METTPVVATPEPAGEDYTPEELVQAMEASLRDFKDGDIMEGVVVKIDRDEILLDIGYKSEGVIPSKELSIRHDVDPNEVVSVGDRIEALVLQKEDKEGRLILSKKRAQYERAWGRIEETMARDDQGPVIESQRGLILDIGPAASCPPRSSISACPRPSRTPERSSSARSSSSIATEHVGVSRAFPRSRSRRAARSPREPRRASQSRAPCLDRDLARRRLAAWMAWCTSPRLWKHVIIRARSWPSARRSGRGPT